MATPATAALLLQTVISMVEPAAQAIETELHVPADTVAKIQTALEAAKAAATGLATAEATSAAQPTMQRAVNDLQGVLTALQPLALPQPVAMGVTAAQFLLPAVMAIGSLAFPKAA